jgi:hypothetical protein
MTVSLHFQWLFLLSVAAPTSRQPHISKNKKTTFIQSEVTYIHSNSVTEPLLSKLVISYTFPPQIIRFCCHHHHRRTTKCADATKGDHSTQT